MDYDTGESVHKWTDHHTLQFKCMVNVPELIKNRLQELLREHGIVSDVHVIEIYDQKHIYKGFGHVYIEKKEGFNILTAHTAEGAPLRQHVYVEEEFEAKDWAACEWKTEVKLRELIISPNDLFVSVPENTLPLKYQGKGEADVSFTLLSPRKIDLLEGLMAHILYAEIPDGVSFDEIEDRVILFINKGPDRIYSDGGFKDYPFITNESWNIKGVEKEVIVIEFHEIDPAARFLMFMIKGIWFYDEDDPEHPTLVSFWNKEEERGGKRGGSGSGRDSGRGRSSPGRGGRGGRGGSGFLTANGGRGGSGRGGSGSGRGGSGSGRGRSSPGRGGSGSGRGGSGSGRGGTQKRVEVDGDGFQTAKRRK